VNKTLAAKFLGVSENATLAEAKAAYKKKASLYHPDKPTGDAEKFKEIQAAYEYFENPSKFRNSSTYSEEARKADPKKNYRADDIDWGDIFGETFKDYYKSAKEKKYEAEFDDLFGKYKTPDQEYNVTITLEQAFNGVPYITSRIKTHDGKIENVTVTIKQGTKNHEVVNFFTRGGVNYIFRAVINPVDSKNVKYTYEYFTHSHDGKNQTKVEAISNGDITRDYLCSVVKMMTGGFVEVETLDGGKIRVRIPEGLESGMKIKLRGKGFWKADSSERGDCYLKVIPDIKTFSKLSTEDLDALVDAAKTEQIIRKVGKPNS
jgi:DnaJ-class molecular chaperone